MKLSDKSYSYFQNVRRQQNPHVKLNMIWHYPMVIPLLRELLRLGPGRVKHRHSNQPANMYKPRTYLKKKRKREEVVMG